MMLTHAPFQPTPDSSDWNPAARGEGAGRDPKHFADMTAYLDKLVGRVVDKLDELKIRENTLVIFLGDNGTGRQITSKFKGQPYPGGKGGTTARGTHVPLIVSWTNKVAAGTVNSDFISSTDFLPTICAAAGADLPGSPPPDGQSFLPQLLGQKGKPREWVYSWFAQGASLKNVHESVMTKQYKLYQGGRFFNLVSDPFEEHPKRISELTGAEAEAARHLTAVLNQYADARPPEVAAAAAKAPAEGEQNSERPRKPRPRRRKSADAAKVQTFVTQDPAPSAVLDR
jgi:arylsulfatase A